MNAIFGIFNHNNAIEESLVNQMSQAIAHRATDGMHIWQEGPIMLGNAMLHITTESLHEQLPLISADGNMMLTASVRLDNRAELLQKLRLPSSPHHVITDADMILAAYQKWGPQCVNHLLGGFAWTIWDKPTQTLFCARDHLGEKPFYYYYQYPYFAFSSELKPLLALPFVQHRVEEERIANFLLFDERDTAHTFYKNFFRLPGGQTLVIREGKISVSQYWDFDLTHKTRYGSDEEYAEHFRELLWQAVYTRMRSAFPIGAQMSGGLDSPSVATMAAKILTENHQPKLRTYSGIAPNTPSSNELEYIDALIATGQFDAHKWNMEEGNPAPLFDEMLWRVEEPILPPNLHLTWKLLEFAHLDGVRVMLTGSEGDAAVSDGYYYLTELAAARDWKRFETEAVSLWQTTERPSEIGLSKIYRHFAYPMLADSLKSLRFLSALYFLNYFHQTVGDTQYSLLWRHGIRTLFPPKKLDVINMQAIPVNARFAKRINLQDRYVQLQRHKQASMLTDRKSHYAMLRNGLLPQWLEILDKLGAKFAIELRHPLLDIRLINYTLSLPADQKLRDGYNRFVFRKAMDGLLPSLVQWRTKETKLTALFSQIFHKYINGEIEAIFQANPRTADFVDIPLIQRLSTRLQGEIHERNLSKVWFFYVLEKWFRSSNL